MSDSKKKMYQVSVGYHAVHSGWHSVQQVAKKVSMSQGTQWNYYGPLTSKQVEKDQGKQHGGEGG